MLIHCASDPLTCDATINMHCQLLNQSQCIWVKLYAYNMGWKFVVRHKLSLTVRVVTRASDRLVFA